MSGAALTARVAPALAPPPSSAEVTAFAGLVAQRLGLAVGRGGGPIARARLRRALQSAGAPDAGALLARLDATATGAPPWLDVAEALTNPETSFFRDPGQLRAVAARLVPAAAVAPGESVRVLSVGCSTGEEVLSLAMLLLDDLHRLWGRRVEVAGLDVNRRSVELARAGRYPLRLVWRAGEGPARWQQRFFRKEGDHLVSRAHLRSLVEFRWANLLASDTWASWAGRFDVVVCRNVLLHFHPDRLAEAQRALLGLVKPGGAIVLGHAEAGLVPALGALERRDGELGWRERPGGGP